MSAHTTVRLAFFAALAVACGSLSAEEKPGGFTLKMDRLDLAVYDVDVDTNSSKFNEYRDWSSGFAIPRMKISGEDDKGRYLEFKSSWVGRRDARYMLDYGVSGKWSMMIDYNKIPHNFGNNGLILFAETSPGRWQISDSIQRSLQTTLTQQFATDRTRINYAYLDGLITPYLNAASTIDLGLQRDRTRAVFNVGQMGRLAWKLDYSHENRTGNRPYGASFGFGNAIELPEPIDYATDGATLSGELSGKHGGLTFGYRYSAFKNDVDALIYDNPFRITDSTDPSAYQAPGSASVGGAAIGQADLAPDNEAGTLFVNGRWRAGSWTMNGALSLNQMKQNDALLPYTLNSAIRGIDFDRTTFAATDPGALPVANADTQVDVLSFSGAVNGKLGKAFTLGFKVRYYDYDNGSSRIEFPGYVRFNGVWEDIGRVTVPYSYTVQDLGADLGWNFGEASRLGLAFNRQSWDRTFREVKDSDEDVIKLTYDTRFGDLQLRAAYEWGDRSIGDYRTEAMEATFIEPEGITNLPALRKYDEAARTYDGYYVQAWWYASEKLDFAFGVNQRSDDYDESRFGLVSDEVLQYNAEVNFAIAEGTNLYAFYQRSEREVFQRSRQSGATPSTNPLDDWDVTFDENNDTAGAGFKSALGERWNIDLGATWNKSDGLADFFSPPGGSPNLAVGFDDYEDIEILSARFALDFQVSENITAGLDYRYEDYTLDSFLVRGLENYMPAALLLNANFGDYTANVVGLRFKLKF
jgi:MtrB/PioB family decaheme-associated outer membrane protein